MSRQIKTYELYHGQFAQQERVYWEPGKRDVDSDPREAKIYRQHHVPIGNPVVEALSRDGKGAFTSCTDTGTGVLTAQSIPEPVITKTSVITIEEVGVQGTHTLNETALVNVNDVAKTAGGYGFEEEP